MRVIASMIKPLLSRDRNFRLSVKASEIIIRNRFLCSVTTRRGVGNTLHVYAHWETGRLGRLIWKRDFSRWHNFCDALKEVLVAANYRVFDLRSLSA